MCLPLRRSGGAHGGKQTGPDDQKLQGPGRKIPDQRQQKTGLKVHGHGGVPQTNIGKDSTRHAQAGAVVAAVEGEGVVQLQLTDDAFELSKLIALYETMLVNCIIVEGYKTAEYPKVVLLKSLSDLKLMQLEHVVAAIRWPDFPDIFFRDIPVFDLADEQQYIEYLLREKA